jgi:serralysin
MPTPFDPVYEILAKEVVYGFDNPQFSAQATAALTSFGYKINQVFNDATTGFQAIGLVGDNADRRPVLVIRGGDGLIDDRAIADPNSIGANQFAANREAIAAWLAKIKTVSPVNADVVGHSLGGAIAQLVAVNLTDQISNVITFNSPGINNSAVETYRQKNIPLSVTHYIVNGDFISLAGEGFLPGTAVLQSYNIPTIDPITTLDKHQQINRLLTTPPAGYSQSEIPVATLSSPNFNFNSESDFQEFITAYRATPGNVANSLTSRGAVETLRRSPNFSFFGTVLGARDAVSADKNNLLVGDNLDNSADGKGGSDRIFGQGGNDQLRGGVSNDRLSGGTGADTLFGDGGDDTLVGDGDDDLLNGGSGRDVLIGSGTERFAGQGEIDQLTGDRGADRFILGNGKGAFYNDRIRNSVGNDDYALITDWQRGDRIQLKGRSGDYVLRRSRGGLPAGVGIYLKQVNQLELIGIVAGQANLNLQSNAFRFV